MRHNLTEHDKQALMYHPVLTYLNAKIESPTYINDIILDSDLSSLISTSTTKVYRDILDLIDRAHGAILETEEKCVDASAPVDDPEYYYGLAPTYLLDLSNGISFKIYKECMDNAPEPLRSEIMDTYETYHMDVNGYINVELYRDLREVYDELLDTKSFYSSAVLTQIDKTTNDIDELETRDNEAISNFFLMKDRRSKLEDEISDIVFNPAKTDKLKVAYDEFYSLDAEISRVQDKLNTKLEVTNVSAARAEIADDLLTRINVLSTFTYLSYDEIVSIITDLTSVLGSEDLTPTIVSLRALIDSQIINLKQLDKQRRSLASREIKLNVSNNLKYGCNVRSNLTTPLCRKLRAINAPANIEPLLDSIADGIIESESKYLSQLDGFYRLDQTAHDMMVSRLEGIERKHIVRIYYKIIKAVRKFISDTGKMPALSDIGSIANGI